MRKDRVAIVTGSSRGIGRSIALSLAEHDWRVVINYRSNHAAAQETMQGVEETGSLGLIIQANIAKRDETKRLVDSTLDRFGRIDLLVNNAGISPKQRVDMLKVSEVSYDEVMQVNLKGPFFLTQRVANEMIILLQEGIIISPKIINIGSISAYASSPSRAEYCISKAGISMFTKLLADRLGEYGINVYEIRPGIIATDMTSAVEDKYDRLIFKEGVTPIRRWGQPEDVSKAVIAIVEGLLPFSTGEVVNVDGGFHLHRL